MARTIHLHGAAAIHFGSSYSFECDTPREAIHALLRLKKGFKQFVAGADWRIVRGPIGGLEIDETMLGLRFGSVSELHLIPVASGAIRGKMIGKIVLGVALIAAAVIFAPAAAGGAAAAGAAAGAAGGAAAGAATGLSATAFLGITYAQIALAGVSLALSGISQLLAPNPKVGGYSDREHPESRPSFLFNGPVNTAEQGAVIPIVYGKRVRVGSVVGAAGIYVEDIPVGSD